MKYTKAVMHILLCIGIIEGSNQRLKNIRYIILHDQGSLNI